MLDSAVANARMSTSMVIGTFLATKLSLPRRASIPVAIDNCGAAGLEINMMPRNRWVNPDGSQKYTVEQRFWMQVDKRGPDECWPWLGSINPDGYGMLAVDGRRTNGHHRTSERAHRMAWKIGRGPIPPGMHVCHHCDTPSCCNFLSHLFLGTHADNMNDMARKGRGRSGDNRGEKFYDAKWTWEQVGEMRRMAADGIPRRIIREKFAVSASHLNGILLGYFWKESK